MCEDRLSNLKDLVRFSTKATLVVPSILLSDYTNNFEAYHDFTIALYCLENDDGLIVSKKELDDDLSEITIEIRDD